MHGGAARGSRFVQAVTASAPSACTNGPHAHLDTAASTPSSATSASTRSFAVTAPAAPAEPAAPTADQHGSLALVSKVAAHTGSTKEHAGPSTRLPAAYAHLRDCFAAIERTLPLLRARGLPPFFGLLVKSVEAATQRSFRPEHLAGVLGVWPDAYQLSVVELTLSEQRARLAANKDGQKCDWVIERPAPLAPASASQVQQQHSTAANSAAVATVIGGGAAMPSREAVPIGGAARLAEFTRRLEALVHSHAAAATESGGTHELDELCPPPPTACLPALVRKVGDAVSTAVPKTAADTQPASAATASASQALPAVHRAASAPSDHALPAAAAPLAVPASCAGLPPELVQKVLQRQAAEQQKLVEAPVLQRGAHFRRLPEMAAAMRSCMQVASRRIMPQAELVRKLTINGRWLASADELVEQQRLLCELVPHWCQLVRVGEQAAVKIDNSVRFAEVLQTIKAACAKVDETALATTRGHDGLDGATR
jgi:hypothetical protein